MKWVKLAAGPDRGSIAVARAECGALWIELCGSRTALQPSGALWIPDEAMLVAGDLHLEKGSSYAARGQLLPPYDTLSTLIKLEAEIARLQPKTVVLLGDSFHDPRALGRLAHHDARRIGEIGRARRLIWVVGNHDEDLEFEGGQLPGMVLDEVRAAGLTLRHEPREGLQPGEVSGHLHPCAKLVSRGRGVRRRAFLTDGSRLILPAFGAYAGGLNACDSAFFGLFDGCPLAAVMGEDAVHPIHFSALHAD